MSDALTIKVPRLQPLTTPLQLKEATVRDYTRAAERAGQTVDPLAIERLAVRDCEIYGRVQADAEPAAPQTPEQLAEVRRIKREQLEREAQTYGATVDLKGKVKKRKVKQAHATTKPDERFSLAKGRVLQICRGATRHPDPKVATSTCEMPQLALAIYRLYALFATRWRMPKPGDEANPFFGRSDEDAGNILQRAIEDICDLSTGRLGAWRTPR